MEIITRNKTGEEVIVSATDQNMTVPILYNNKLYYCKWYTYGDSKNTVAPFVNFNNDSIILYCNDLNHATFNDLSPGGQNLFEFYAYILNKMSYNNNLRSYVLDGSTKFIYWNLSPNYSVKLSKDKAELNINYDGSKSHFELMTQILRELQEGDIIRYIHKSACRMGIGNKITNCFIVDPDTRDRYNYDYSDDKKPITMGVLGTSYKKSSNSKYVPNGDSKSECTLLLSPFIYYMEPNDQKILIIHELVHIKIGVEHQHDSYFWHMFEKYSGISRNDDWTYSKQAEWYNTQMYDKHYSKNGITNADLINYSINK